MIKTEALNVLIEAIKFCNSIGLWGCIYNEDLTDSVEFHNFQEKKLDFNITLDNKIEICREDDFYEKGNEISVINVGDFVCLYSNIEEYEIINTSIVYGSKMALFLVDAADDFTTVKLINLPYLDDWCHSTVCVDGEEYTVEFISKRQAIFDILLVKDQNFDKDVPFSVCDYFIKVSAKNKIDRKVAENLAEAFIFELSTNHNILLTHATRVTKFNLDSIEVTENSCKKLLPLLTGNGISEVIRLYNQAVTFDSFDYQILTFTKIIEYIAPTVAREKLNNRIFQKLSSPQVLNPNANFISELQKIFDNQRQYQKDSELIKLTVLEIVDFDEIKRELPAFLIRNREQNKDKDQEMLCILSQAISDTRNYIAHAKANYRNKGLECPEDEKERFIIVLRIIARQCIRWFANQPDNKRVLVQFIEF